MATSIVLVFKVVKLIAHTYTDVPLYTWAVQIK